MNSVGIVGSLARLCSFLQILHKETAPGCRILFDVSPPDWSAVHIAARRRYEPLPKNNFSDRQWAVLHCWFTLGKLQGRTFPYLFAEPWAAAAAARQSGWSVTLAFEDTGTRHALLQLEKRPGS